MDAPYIKHASEMAKLQNQHKRQLDTAQTNLATKEAALERARKRISYGKCSGKCWKTEKCRLKRSIKGSNCTIS